MDALDLDSDSFYICTEVASRCYVVQRAIQIDKSQIERVVDSMEKQKKQVQANGTPSNMPPPPPPPPLPFWFTPECKEKLLRCESPAKSVASTSHPVNYQQYSEPDLRTQLKTQLEYYFSRENMITDRYLRCQMDSQQYVPISVIARFRKVAQLTDDLELIVDVLRESNQVEVDEKGEKVKPVSKRCTIILRDIEEKFRPEIEKMLQGGPAYADLKFGLNDSWYVTFDTEEITQQAYLYLQHLDTTFNNKPICARIKAGPPPMADAPPQQYDRPSSQMTDMSDQSFGMMDFGQVLAHYGYVPRAIYRPGSTVVHLDEAPAGADTPIVDGRNFRYRHPTTSNYVPSSSEGSEVDQMPCSSNGRRQEREFPEPVSAWTKRERQEPRYRNEPRPVQPSTSTSTSSEFRRPGRAGPRRWADAHVENNQQETVERKRNSTSSNYSFEEQAFPELCEKKPQVVKPPPKPTFSSVTAGVKNAKPEVKKSYAEKLKERKKT